MIWVILIHSIFWSGLLKDHLIGISYLLIEMPIFFFITGASNSLGSPKSLLQFYTSRLKRIMFPYWAYAISCYFIIHITINYFGQPADKLSLINWLFPYNTPWSNISYLNWHLWFIPAYLFVILFFPFLKLIYNKLNGPLKLLPPIILVACLFFLDFHGFFINFIYIKHILAYSLFSYLGFFYPNFKRTFKNLTYLSIFCATCLLITYLLINNGVYPVDMQSNKFPPNTVFVLYNLGILSFLVIIKKHLLFFMNIFGIRHLIQVYATRGYSIYLFHPFSFIVMNFIILDFKLTNFESHPVLSVISFFIFITLFNIVIAKLFGNIEKFDIKILKRVK